MLLIIIILFPMPQVEASPTSTVRTVPEMICFFLLGRSEALVTSPDLRRRLRPSSNIRTSSPEDDDSSSKFRSPLLRQMLANKQKAKAAASDAAELNGSNSDAKICDAAAPDDRLVRRASEYRAKRRWKNRQSLPSKVL